MFMHGIKMIINDENHDLRGSDIKKTDRTVRLFEPNTVAGMMLTAIVEDRR
jgi:UDP-N-acetylmuramate-alanine ligase